MVQITVLSGKKAGTQWVARRFPIRIGRSPDCDLSLDGDGVWDRHLELNMRMPEGFFVSVVSGALAAVNGNPVKESALRNGDTIEIGAVKLRFWLAPPKQSGLRLREGLTWAFLTGMAAGQVALIYWLLAQ